MLRVAIYARDAPGHYGRTRLHRQVAVLATHVTRQPGWHHVATYGDLDLGPAAVRPGLARLQAEAPGRIDVVVVDGYGRLSTNRHELGELLAHLGAVGVQTVVLPPSGGQRLARLVANLALADVIGTAAR